MAFSKIILNSTTLMDVTDTTAAAADVGQGKYFYTAAGVKTAGTASGGGGGGLTTVASGTFTGTGVQDIAVNVGTKMPQTDFWVKFVAKSNTEFAYDINYKPAYMFAMVTSDNGHFDLSSVADSKQVISDLTFDIDNSGSITHAAAGTYIGHMTTVRNTGAANYGRPNNFRINRKSDHFEVRIYQSNASYAYPSGIVYDWEVVYFGTSPSTDIVEI